MKNSVTQLIVILSALALTACGQGMNSGNPSEATLPLNSGMTGGGGDIGRGGPGVSAVDYEAIQQQALKDASDAEAAADAAIAEAEKALDKISLGSGGVSFGDSGSLSQQVVVDKLVKKILDKVIEKLQVIPNKFDKIRAKLAAEISKLDSNNPLHQRGIDALMVAMSKVDMVESKYKDMLSMVADKVDLISGKLDMLAAAVPFPANLLVALELNSVKGVLRDFQHQMRNL